MGNEMQPARTERLTIAATPYEKRAAEFVALARNKAGVSNLLREMSLDAVVAEYERIMAKIHEEAA